MSEHLGNRTGALLDGALSPEESERGWSHVQECHECRDLVEREGWMKRRLACLAVEPSTTVSDSLRANLMDPSALSPGHAWIVQRPRRSLTLAALGGSAVGAAVVGVIALVAAPAAAPTTERRPVTSVYNPGPALFSVKPAAVR
jgi:predicted anti-sigma-YlaC factor YlaD